VKILLLGASHAELPIVRAAKQRNLRIETLANAAFPATVDTADGHHDASYSEVARVQEIIAAGSFDAVIAGANDFAAMTAAIVGRSVGVGNHDDPHTSEQIHHKDAFRKVCVDLGIPSPKALVIESSQVELESIEGIELPVIVKPIDLTGGKGVSTCRTIDEVPAAVEIAYQASRIGRIVVEQFIDGPLRSALYLWSSDELTLLVDADEYSYRNPFMVSAAVTPSSNSQERLTALSDSITRIARWLKLVDGLVHVQYISSRSRDYVIEVCRRPPGDLYIDLPTRFLGVTVPELIIDIASGLIDANFEHSHAPMPTIRQCVMAPRNGMVSSMRWTETMLARMTRFVELNAVPFRVERFMSEKLGILFATSVDRGELTKFATRPETAYHLDFDDDSNLFADGAASRA
jgi:biotin carboxylase